MLLKTSNLNNIFYDMGQPELIVLLLQFELDINFFFKHLSKLKSFLLLITIYFDKFSVI